MSGADRIIRIGITGQVGFIGTHLFNTLGLYDREFERMPFFDPWFSEPGKLAAFVSSCDVIVHLAAVNRHHDPEELYDINIRLVESLIRALESTGATPHLLFASSTQEERDNLYGRSKKEGRILLANWAKRNKANFTGFVIPNVFGPFGNPYYNSVIATFAHQLNHGEIPRIEIDAELSLIYVGEVVQEIIHSVRNHTAGNIHEEVLMKPSTKAKVTDLLHLLQSYKTTYLEQGSFPDLKDRFEINLFNTFRCFMDIGNYFPKKFKRNADERGVFTELVKTDTGGQFSFSTTIPGITRGNHYHTRKIERFAVIKGEARIQLRRIGTEQVFDFYLSGNEPAYVDMPIWYTHNITNIGNEELYTVFWINEPYDPEDPDTFYEKV